jgi:hypothetical protein
MNGKTEIWESVEEFRQKHLGDLGKVPVDCQRPAPAACPPLGRS